MTTLAEALAPKSDQLNADDLIPGPRVLKITDARISKDARQTKIFINFEGDQGKPWKPCKTMGRAMIIAWEVTDEKQLIGKSVRVYRDPEVTFGDQGAIGGIRISHMSDIDKPAIMKLTVSQSKKATFTFHPLVTEAGKPDKAAEGTHALIANLQAVGPGKKAETILASAEVVKQREYLASKRPELAAELNAAIAALEAADESPFEPPSASKPTPDDDADNQGADHGGDSQEGRAVSDLGEFEPARAVADRLIADARAGAGRSGSEQAEFEALPEDLRAEVVAAGKGER